ncbi:MAG: flap endonuclease [Gammaproteobacteria bacterium]|nr:MAG: flap endonuclease [Gammaproteobacteria bacterium]
MVDASVYVFRAWFSLPASLTDPAGRPVNAFYGFARFLLELLAAERPVAIACAFDESLTTSFRNEVYPDYKANRDPAPEELKHQFALCRRLCRALGVLELGDPRFEADDLIGSLMHHHRGAYPGFAILTRDKDLAQLLGPGDVFWDYAAGVSLDAAGVERRFGLPPERIAELLALTGDAVDNIPGVPGIGPKTATALLAHFGGLDALMAGLDALPDSGLRGAKRLAALLAEHADTVALARQLTVISTDAPIPRDPAALRRSASDPAALAALFDEAGVGTRLRALVV